MANFSDSSATEHVVGLLLDEANVDKTCLYVPLPVNAPKPSSRLVCCSWSAVAKNLTVRPVRSYLVLPMKTSPPVHNFGTAAKFILSEDVVELSPSPLCIRAIVVLLVLSVELPSRK